MSSNQIKLRLYYFDCRGAAQACRYMLEDIAHAHQNVDYKEDFEEIATMHTTWKIHKADPTISGPFGLLPVLHWNENQTFGQTLTIGLCYSNVNCLFFNLIV